MSKFNSFISFCAGLGGGILLAWREYRNKLANADAVVRKNDGLFMLMNRWLKLKQDGESIEPFFTDNGIRTIAIYGMSYVGERLIDDLKGTSVEIRYGIDRRAGLIQSEIDIFALQPGLPKVDAVVVTAVSDFETIQDRLLDYYDCEIISLANIVYEI